VPNFLFLSENGQHFKESSLLLGGAVSATGEPQANMGIAFGDYDGNGLPDLCVTHFTGEGVALFIYQKLCRVNDHRLARATLPAMELSRHDGF